MQENIIITHTHTRTRTYRNILVSIISLYSDLSSII